MTEYQRLFLVQARTDYAVFELLRKQAELPACHALHYLQMATELLGKAYAWKTGPAAHTHRALASFLTSVSTNRKAQLQLGFKGKNQVWKEKIRASMPLAKRIEDLAPALALDGPNPEYPWPRDAPAVAPAEHTFGIWLELESPAGRRFLKLIGDLFGAADAYI